MTDNEIVKVVECCSKLPQRCKECPLMIPGGCGSINKYAFILDLINRQKAEIERLKAHEQMAEGYADALVEMTKAEAYKEFAERLKSNADVLFGEVGVRARDVDNLLKEMAGEDKDVKD